MTQPVLLTHGNPNLSYQSAALPAEDAMESSRDGVPDSVAPDRLSQRFPGWLRLAIIGSGAILSWAAVAGAAGWLR